MAHEEVQEALEGREQGQPRIKLVDPVVCVGDNPYQHAWPQLPSYGTPLRIIPSLLPPCLQPTSLLPPLSSAPVHPPHLVLTSWRKLPMSTRSLQRGGTR